GRKVTRSWWSSRRVGQIRRCRRTRPDLFGTPRASKTPQKVLNFRGVNMKNLRLLIVDDEQASRYGMRRALESLGYEIAEAESAEAAHALMTNANFDLLLLDVNLPGISGLDFLSQLQSESEGHAESPLVIIITA